MNPAITPMANAIKNTMTVDGAKIVPKEGQSPFEAACAVANLDSNTIKQVHAFEQQFTASFALAVGEVAQEFRKENPHATNTFTSDTELGIHNMRATYYPEREIRGETRVSDVTINKILAPNPYFSDVLSALTASHSETIST